jgi:membrane fusion protein, multidrug efflux system
MNNIIRSIIAITLVAVLASCGGKEEKKAVSENKAPAYTMMALQPRQMNGDLQLPGVMQPFEFVQLFPKVSGFVKSVPVDRGSIVHQGEVLITLEAPEIEQQIAAARLRYTQAQANYITSRDRYHRLLETSSTPGTVSAFDLEAAEAKMQGDSATTQGEYANYKAQQALGAYLIMTAPFDGVITERNVHPGALAGPGSDNAKPMLILQQLSRLRLTVDVPEQDVTQVKDGDIVHYRVNALPGQDFTGKVSRSSHSLSSNFRSETLEIDVANTDGKFKPGMYAEVVLPTSGSANAFVVPRSAIITTQERKYVIGVDGAKAKLIDISEGNRSKDSSEVFGDLHSGEQVIVNAGYQIKDGDVIR